MTVPLTKKSKKREYAKLPLKEKILSGVFEVKRLHMLEITYVEIMRKITSFNTFSDFCNISQHCKKYRNFT